MDTLQQPDEKRFILTYRFVMIFGLLTLSLITAIVFGKIPKDNQQSANMALAFCMSAFTGLMGYLIGASPDKKKDAPLPPNTTSTTATVTTTEPVIDPEKKAA